MLAARILELTAAGMTAPQIALRLGCSERQVYYWRARPERVQSTPSADHSWMERAACRGHDPEMFFPHPSDGIGRDLAQSVCQRCPVIEACGRWADDTSAVGVWGGVLRCHEGGNGSSAKVRPTLSIALPEAELMARFAAIVDTYDDGQPNALDRAAARLGLCKSSVWNVLRWAMSRGWWTPGRLGYPTEEGRQAVARANDRRSA